MHRRTQARRTATALASGELAAVTADAREALARSDDATAAHVVSLRASSSLACGPRCAHCCRLDVAITFPEAAHLAESIQATFAPEALAALRSRLDARVAEDAAVPDGAAMPVGRSCPLLVDDNCSAYEARPLACRGWNSAEVGPCVEAASRPGDAHRIPVHRILRDTAHALAQGIQDGAREHGLDDDALDLPRALHALLQDREGLTSLWLEGRKLPLSLRSRSLGMGPPR